MRKLIVLINLLASAVYSLEAQLGKDSFYFRNDMHANYNLYVKLNDSNAHQLRIIEVKKMGLDTNLYTLEISTDSNFINIKSPNISLVQGNFMYKTILGSAIDSTTVYFERKSMVGDLYPGDCNRDNLVNHMDLFPIGIMYGKHGSPRNLADTNLIFNVPKKVNNWFYEVRGINAKHADVDGNGWVDENDLAQLKRNFGQDKGNYLPIFSYASNDVKLTLSIPDTVKLLTSKSTLSVPIVINSPTPVNAYGLGFSYTVRLYDKDNIAQSRFYPYTKYNRTNVWDELTTLYLIDTQSHKEHVNVAYCRKNHVNGDMDPQGGIIDIIIEDVLIGIANPGEQTFLNIYLKEVALIDNNYNTIPISPISKRIYLQKATSSIVNATDYLGWSAYPTSIENQLTILNPLSKKGHYMIYNALGQLITSGTMSNKVEISTGSWPQGIYFIKNDLNSEVIRVQK